MSVADLLIYGKHSDSSGKQDLQIVFVMIYVCYYESVTFVTVDIEH